MTLITQAMPYLLAAIAPYALTVSLLSRGLFGQLNAIRVRSRRTDGR